MFYFSVSVKNKTVQHIFHEINKEWDVNMLPKYVINVGQLVGMFKYETYFWEIQLKEIVKKAKHVTIVFELLSFITCYKFM